MVARRVLSLLLGITTLFSVSSVAMRAPLASRTGINGSIDLQVLNQAKHQFFEQIIDFIDDIKIPDVQLKGNKGYLIENSFLLDTDDMIVNFYNDITNNALVFEADNLSASFHCGHFKLKEGFVQAKGSADVTLERLKLQVGISLTEQMLPDGRQIPAINTVDVNFLISQDDISVELHGNVWSEFAGSFVNFFKGPMVRLIESSCSKALNLEMPNKVNEVIAASNGHMEYLLPHWKVDCQTPTTPIVGVDHVEAGIVGLFFDDRIGEYDRVRFPPMPFKNETMLHGMQAFISMQSLDSFFEAMIDVSGGDGWYNQTMLPPPLDFQLTTTDLNILMPGMIATYGKGRQVKLNYDVLYVGDFRSRYAKDYLISSATLNVKFWVVQQDGTEDLAVDMNLYNITNKVTVTVEDFSINAFVREFRLHGVEVTHSTIGMLNPNTIRLKLNTVNQVIVTLTNVILQRFQLPIPSDIFGIFQLSDLVLEYFDGYIYAGATPTFLPPTLEYGMNDLTASTFDGHSHPTHAPERTVHYQGNEFMFIEQ